jgi:hypothetical protein
MKKIALAIVVLAAALVLQSYAGSAWAQCSSNCYFRTWIAATGDDSNTSTGCQPSAPCKTFSGAIGVTVQGGEANCLGPSEIGNAGAAETPIAIKQAITIDCHGTFGGNLTITGVNAVVINASGAVVTLRGLNLEGYSGFNGGTEAGLNGVLIEAAAVVNIEDSVIENFLQRGIDDVRTSGATTLFIKNTVVRGNGGSGIVAAAAATNSVMLENVHSVGNSYGLAVATGNHVTVSRSVMFGNATAGLEVDPGGQLYVDYTEIANNGTGIQTFGNVALGNSGIVSNTTGISGTTTSYGNNRIFANFAAGNAPTPIGGASPDYGQQ